MSTNKPIMLGPQASRAAMAHIAAQQFFPETVARDDIDSNLSAVHLLESQGRSSAAMYGADESWGEVQANTPPDRPLNQHQRGELKANTPEYLPHQIEGIVWGDPRAKSDMGRRNRVWQSNAEMN